MALLLGLIGCNQNTAENSSANTTDQAIPTNSINIDEFKGCYSVEKGVPAQILIGYDNGGFAMQMKEPDGSWDKPESLIISDKDKAWELYQTNSLGLNKSDITTTLVRPDGVMAISRLVQGTAVNPAIDSSHVVMIMGAVNTIYSVPCDNAVPTTNQTTSQ